MTIRIRISLLSEIMISGGKNTNPKFNRDIVFVIFVFLCFHFFHLALTLQSARDKYIYVFGAICQVRDQSKSAAISSSDSSSI